MATQWQSYESGSFACELPPGWTFEPADQLRDPGVILMRDADRSIALVITTRPQPQKEMTISLRTQEAREQLHRWVQRLSHIRLYESPHAVPSEGRVICTTEGSERIRTGVPWLKRLLHLGPRMLWRFWAILNSNVLVLASCNGKPEAVERHRETVNKIIESIHLPIQPATAPSKKTSTSGAETRGSRLRWSEIREQVLPLLVPTHRLGDYGENLIQQPWVNELSIIYAMPDPQKALTVAQCERWRVNVDALHEQALHNLVSCSQELTMEGGRADGYTMLAFAKPDPYNAMRILLPDLHHKLREYLGATFYVAIPNRTFMLAFATEQEEILNRVRQQIKADYTRLPNPVSSKLFIMTADGVAGADEEMPSDGTGESDTQ